MWLFYLFFFFFGKSIYVAGGDGVENDAMASARVIMTAHKKWLRRTFHVEFEWNERYKLRNMFARRNPKQRC